MTDVLETTIKLSLIVLLALAGSTLLRKRSAALRHWVLSVALVSAAAAPLLESMIPGWHVQLGGGLSASTLEPFDDPAARRQELSVSVRQTIITPVPPTPSTIGRRLPAATVLAVIWIAGTAISLGILLVGFVRLTRRAGRAQRVVDGTLNDMVRHLSHDLGLRRPVLLLQSDDPALLVTWGVARPKVILPATARDWPADRLRSVICHELAHIRRGDWAVQIAAELVRSIYWFNPLFRIACRRLRRESEQACDDAVLSVGVTGPDYASHLLDVARSVGTHRRASLPALAMAHTESLERRIKAMLNAHVNRRPITHAVRAAATCVVLALTVSIIGFQTGAAQALATFSGSVFDSTSRIVPEATLVLVNVQTNAAHEARSDQSGRFEFVGLPPGSYLLENLTAGFRKSLGKVKLGGQHLQQDVTLQVGTLQETISVTGGPARSERGGPVGPDRRPQKRDATGCVSGATGGKIRQPWKVRDVRPAYPQHLQEAKVEGTVGLDALIGVDGLVREVKVIGDAHPGLTSAAIEAVRQWEFDSTLLNCEPIEVSMTVTVNFTVER